MIIAISTYLFGRPLNKDDVKQLNNAGIKYIEFLIDEFEINPDIEDFIRRNNIQILSIHSNGYNNPSSIDHIKRSNTIEDIKTKIDRMKRLNGRFVVVHPGWDFTDNNERSKRIDNSISRFVEVTRYAYKNDVKIVIENDFAENGYYTLGDNIEDMDYIIKEVRKISGQDKNIGLCLDTGHGFLTSNLFELVDFFGNDIFTIHLSDNLGPGHTDKLSFSDDLHILPGEGAIDWKTFFKKLKKCHYEGGLVYELSPLVLVNSNTENVLKKLTDFKRKLFRYIKDN